MKIPYDISLLVESFLGGETTIAEERRLDEFFMSHEPELGEMSEHLQIVAEMFRELRTMSSDAIGRNGRVQASIKKPYISLWVKWAAAIAAACLALFFVLFPTNDTNPLLEEKQIQIADFPMVEQPDTINVHQTERNQTDDRIGEAPKNKPIKRQEKPLGSKTAQEVTVSTSSASEILCDKNVQNGRAMLCGFTPGANMLPMHTDVTIRAVVSECEMSILEDEFQESERNRKTIEI